MTNEKYQLLPELPPEQFAALKADIAARGVMVAVIVDEFGTIIDGHNRVSACRELGINDYPVDVRSGLSETDKRALSRQLNVLRRHLSRKQVRALIVEQVRETPEWANNRIAQMLAVDDKTVASVRDSLEATSEIPKLDRLVGADGKARRQPIRRARSQADADDGWDDDNWDDDVDYRPQRRVDPWDDPTKRAKVDHAIDLIKLGVDPNSKPVNKLLHEGSAFVMQSPPGSYDPLHGRSDEEKREWHLFMLFLARVHGWHPEAASQHVEWVLQRPFQNVAEWLGQDGDKFRNVNCIALVLDATKRAWRAFLEQDNRPLPEIIAELEALASQAGTLRSATPQQTPRGFE